MYYMVKLHDKIKGILIKYLKFDLKKFEPILDKIIEEQLIENANIVKVDEESERKLKLKVNKTKQRWYNLELDKTNKKSIYLTTMKNIEELLISENKELFNHTENKSIDEFKEEELNRLQSWHNSKHSLLVEFPYFYNKNSRSQITAIKNDVEMLSYRFFNFDFERCKTNFPQLAYKVPFDSSNRKSFPANNEEDGFYLQDIQDNEGGTKVRINKSAVIKENDKLFMLPEVLNNTINDVYNAKEVKDGNMTLKARGLMLETIKVLGDLDRNVLFNTIRRIDENSEEWVNRGTVSFYIKDITKDIYETVSYKNCKAVRHSLKKLKELNISKFNDKIQGTWFNLIDFLNIDENDYATVDIGKVLKNEISNMRTIQIFDDVISELKNPVAKLIIFILQEKRIKLAIQKQHNKICSDDYLFFRTSYLFFTVSVYFDKKYKKKYIESIRDGLNELKENNVLIEDFEVVGDFFNISFKEFSSEELRIIAEEENPFAYVVLGK